METMLMRYKSRESAVPAGRRINASKHKLHQIVASLAEAGNRLISFIIFGLAALCFINTAEAIEEPKYKVLVKEENFEIRQYEAYLVAETIVEGDFSEVSNEGFRRLFKFISGENRLKQSIPMTAPVSQEASKKIEMMAPVQQQKEEGMWRIGFVMPSGYTLDTVPYPLDERIHIKEVPGALVAAVRYSGTWNRKRYEERKLLLKGFILRKGFNETGEAIFARYNPPFKPWFLRRNEVLIPVKSNDPGKK
jgi:hypothetical protein